MSCGGCDRCKMPDAVGTDTTAIITIKITPGGAITPAKVKKLAAKAADTVHDTLADEYAVIQHTWAIYEGAKE